MGMTRIDYIQIASVLAARKPRGADDNETAVLLRMYWSDIAADLATVFSIDNPRFDRERFLKSCGVEG